MKLLEALLADAEWHLKHNLNMIRMCKGSLSKAVQPSIDTSFSKIPEMAKPSALTVSPRVS